MHRLKPLFTLSLTALFFLGSSFSFADNNNPSLANDPTSISLPQVEAIIALAYLNTQGGSLEIAAKVLGQISTLKIHSGDFTQTPAELDAYERSFIQLRDLLKSLQNETFLGAPLFGENLDTGFPEGLASIPDLAQAIHEVTEATSLLEVTLEVLIASEGSVIDLQSQNAFEAKQLEEALQHAEA